VEHYEPSTLIAIRSVVAVPLLFLILCASRGVGRSLRELRVSARDGIVLGAINTVLPTILLAYGQKHVDSGTAAIANATVPIFVLLILLRFRPQERIPPMRLVGIGLGLLGVIVLAGARPPGGWWGVGGTLFVVGNSLVAAAATVYVQVRSGEHDSLLLITGATAWGFLLVLPAGVLQYPAGPFDAGATTAALLLGLLSSALGMIVLFHMIAQYGSSRTSVIGYLLPAVGLVLGVVALHEPVTATKLIGFVVILAGVALGSGVSLRRAAAAPGVDAEQ
jgi:drug/metabolite transporter (DMT)-like permease